MKLSIFILSLLIFSSCTEKMYQVKNLIKSNHLPGHSGSNSYSQYTFEIDLKKTIKIKSIQLENYGLINKWYYKDLNSGLGSTLKKETFTKGNYELGFKVEGNEQFNISDTIIIEFEYNGQIYLKKINFPKPSTTSTDK